MKKLDTEYVRSPEFASTVREIQAEIGSEIKGKILTMDSGKLEIQLDNGKLFTVSYVEYDGQHYKIT